MTKADPDPENLVFWQAFWMLSGSRQQTFGGSGPIAMSEIVAYCELIGIASPQDRFDFARTVQAMDREFMAFHESRRPQS